MHIIPVIDIKDGQAVAAIKGQRAFYTPLETPLSASPEPQKVIQGLLDFYPFDTVYCADLNAITRQGNNRALLHELLECYPKVTFWIDEGLTANTAIEVFEPNYRAIIGSECQNDSIGKPLENRSDAWILSLDFFPDSGYRGPKQLLQNPNLWPENVIIMSLAHVGLNQGPDFEKLNYFCQRYPQHKFVCAGGIRNTLDLQYLIKMGVKQALVASAIHNGQLTPDNLRELAKKCPD
jgi:phosphoribosylformimino-5-aminoimidazole carboxamide ribotide isomerase